MALQPALQNNFIGGLKTEFTGLNFPENACTDTQNCVFSIIGDVTTREGINFESNFEYESIAASSEAITQYFWRNAGGDGQTTVLVVQTGNTLNFYLVSASTTSSPLSRQLLASTVTISTFQAVGNVATVSQAECQFADGNGYLFVFHPDCDPFYCTYNAGTITANLITLQIRDVAGIYEPGVSVSLRPTALTAEHQYNLQNQGWVSGSPWGFTSTSQFVLTTGHQTFAVASGVTGVSSGQLVQIGGEVLGIGPSGNLETGDVVSYTGSTLVVNVLIIYGGYGTGAYVGTDFTITPISTGYLTTWFGAEGNYPSNADIWYEFKDDTNVFNPAVTEPNVTVGNGQAPQGHYIFNPFIQQRSLLSGITGLTDVVTSVRPRTGTFWQGRVWYAGADASQAATGDAAFYTWTENIYFSQVVTVVSDFGTCYQANDPTDETLNQLLPTDGGVISIPGLGAVHKLFNMQNSLLIFSTNGIWVITGNQGIGFTANAYSVNKISSVPCISGSSIVDINGVPIFWNEEGIYMISPNADASPYNLAGFKVEPLTVGTILTFYNNIPKDSKRHAKGTYDPVSYIVQWTYRTTQESGIVNRYQMDGVLSLNVFNRAFYPYTISSNNACYVAGPQYIVYPTSLNTPDPIIKYLTIVNGTKVTFAEENDNVSWFDWFAYDGVGVPYTSYFVTGYRLEGSAVQKFAPTYLNMFSRNNYQPNGYYLQGIWDYASSGLGGKYTSIQQITNMNFASNMIYRRHKLRGHGMSLQFKVANIPGMPFDIMGWSEWSNKDTAF